MGKAKCSVIFATVLVFATALEAGISFASAHEEVRAPSQHFDESVIVTGYTLDQIDAVPEEDLLAVRSGIIRDRQVAAQAKRLLGDLVAALDERIGGGESEVRKRIRERKERTAERVEVEP